jgi:hypothetical protein
VHRELAVSNKVHEALWNLFFFLLSFFFFPKEVGVDSLIVFLLKEDLVWRGENAFKFDHKLCNAFVVKAIFVCF